MADSDVGPALGLRGRRALGGTVAGPLRDGRAGIRPGRMRVSTAAAPVSCTDGEVISPCSTSWVRHFPSNFVSCRVYFPSVDAGSLPGHDAAMNRETLATLFDLTDRVAIVTGGTRASAAHRRGVRVCRRQGRRRQPQSRRLRRDRGAPHERVGGEALGVPTHLGDLDQLQALVDRTVERYGRLDIVVNNAANALDRTTRPLHPEAWDKSFGVNLRGPVFLSKRRCLTSRRVRLRRGRERVVGRRIPSVDARPDVLGGQGGDARVHPRRWRRVRRSDPGERARRPAPSTPTWCATTRPRRR